MQIGDVCNREVVTVSRNDSILDAVKKMRAHHVGDVVVTKPSKNGERPVGILTDRDVVIEILAKEVDMNSIDVGDAMSLSIVTAPKTAELFETVRFMGVKGVRRLPVLDDDGGLYGVLSIDDAVKVLATELEYVADVFSTQMERERSLRD